MLWGEKKVLGSTQFVWENIERATGQADRQTDRQTGRVNSKIECGSTFVRLALKEPFAELKFPVVKVKPTYLTALNF
jgi:hypothetical protein